MIDFNPKIRFSKTLLHQIYAEGIVIDEREIILNQQFHSSALYTVAFEEAKDLLTNLEHKGYLENKEVVHEGTPRLLLEDFLSEIISYIVKPTKVGSKVIIRAVKEKNNLKINIINSIIPSTATNANHQFSFQKLANSLGWSMGINKNPYPNIFINIPCSSK